MALPHFYAEDKLRPWCALFTLQMLGGISLTDDAGAEVDALLRQSKHVALLAYLASPRPGTWHKRDTVIGTFWAEHDQTRARSAFRSALYILRGHLPEGAIRSRGDNDLSVDPVLVRTDVAAMADLLDRGDYSGALALYKGEFLPGIYVADAEGFDQWLQQERRRARDIAGEAAKQLSRKLESEKDQSGAIRAARQNYELDPDDEGTVRRLISLLDVAGDRAQAFAVYEEFRNHVYEAFGVRPSAETVALLDAIRTRHEPGQLPAPAAPPPRSTEPTTSSPEIISAKPRSRRSLAWLALPAVLAVIAWAAWPRDKAVTAGRTMVVLPVANETGDPSLDYLARGVGEDLARQLTQIGSLDIRSAARSEWSRNTGADLRGVSRAYNASYLVRTSMSRSLDSLRLQVNVIDGATLKEKPVAARYFSQASLSDVESRIVAAIAGNLFSLPGPPPPKIKIDPESEDLTRRGYDRLLSNVRVPNGKGPTLSAPEAMDLFIQARNIDPRNARAWAGWSSTLAARIMGDQVPFDDGYAQASMAARHALALDSTQGTALANLALLEALNSRRVSAGDSLMRKAEMAEPWNPEVYLVKSVLYRFGHMWDQARDAIRIARSLDPLSPTYLERESIVEFCAGRPDKALALLNEESSVAPVQGAITRALALLGRYDEALDSWRKDPDLQSDIALRSLVTVARGSDGYWKARHASGQKRLDKLVKDKAKSSTFPFMRTVFAAGDSTQGFALLERLVDKKVAGVYRLGCNPDFDEFRNTPHFRALVAKAGALPP